MLYKVKITVLYDYKEIVYIGKQILFYLYLFTSKNSKITTSVSNTYIFHYVESIAPG